MRYSVVALFGIGLVAMGQTGGSQAAGQKSQSSKPASSPVAGSTKAKPAASTSAASAKTKPAAEVPSPAVATLQGLCTPKPGQTDCKTVISREELDRFIKTSAPDAPESARGRIAVQYARNVTYSVLAEQLAMDKNPDLAKELEFQLKLTRSRVLAAAYMANLQRQTSTLTGAEVEAYYDAHREQYERIQIRRVAVPLVVPIASGRRLDPAAVTGAMQALRERAVAGQDLNQLQMEVYQTLQIQATPPPVNVQTVNRGTLQGSETDILALKEGEISPVFDAPAAVVFVKMESRQTAPLDAVRPEIEAGLRRERIQKLLSKFNTKINAKFDLEYLQLASQPDLFDSTPAPVKMAPRTAMRRRSTPTAPRSNPPEPKN